MKAFPRTLGASPLLWSVILAWSALAAPVAWLLDAHWATWVFLALLALTLLLLLADHLMSGYLHRHYEELPAELRAAVDRLHGPPAHHRPAAGSGEPRE